MSTTRPVFTAILDTYYRPALLKEAVDALRRQTYPYLEIILVDNGSTPETVVYLLAVAREDHRIKLVHFKENQYSLDDPLKMLDTCLNAALTVATGDFVWYQADDDLVADDYAEKMVRLFEDNPKCTTAAGLPVSINDSGHVLESGPRTSNIRPRYMSGLELAQDSLRGGRTLFNAPGTIFTIRRDVLVQSGGFNRAIELSHLYGIVPFGITGFDETALFYWRRHEGQLNKALSARGWLGIDETRAIMRDWLIGRRWQVFGDEAAREVVARVERQLSLTTGKWFINNLLSGRFTASLRIARKIWYRPDFWGFALRHLLTWMGKKSARVATRLLREGKFSKTRQMWVI